MFGQSLLSGAFGSALDPGLYFDTKLYTGNSSTQSITGVGFKPDLTWVKDRNVAYQNNLYDSLRGVEALESNSTTAQYNLGGLTSFDSDGFSLGSNVGNNLNNSPLVSWNWKAGTDTYAGVFNGASNGSQILIPDAAVFSPANNDLSFSGWVKTTQTSGSYIFSKQNDGTGTYEIQFYMNSNGTVNLALWTSGGSGVASVTTTATVNDGNWHNVVFVIDTNTSVSVYVDTAVVTSSSWSGTMSNTSADVGLGYGGAGMAGNRFAGSLDQARIFNTALTQSQVTSLYNETASNNDILNFPAGAGCIAAYPLNKTANDLSGNYNGTASNVTYTKPGYTGRNNDGSIESQVSANQDAGFSIVTWTSDGSSSISTKGHGLTSAPELFIVKATDYNSIWMVYQKDLPLNQYIYLDGSDGLSAVGATYYSSSSTTIGFRDGSNSVVGNTMICYCWHSVEGYSKIGTYTGNGGSNPINVGFQPAWVMSKPTSSSGSWIIIDSVRGANKQLYANLSAAEATESGNSFTTTGFEFGTSTGGNTSGVTYIYMAFAVPLT